MEVFPVLRSFFIYVLFYSECICTDLPCSAAPVGSAIVDICTKTITEEPSNFPVLLRVTTMQACKCILSVPNFNSATTIYFDRYQSHSSSHPGSYSCGVGLNFTDKEDSKKNLFLYYQCIVDEKQHVLYKDHTITIESVNIVGTLENNKGYCISISSGMNNVKDTKLQLECGIQTQTVSSPVVPLTTTKAKETTLITSKTPVSTVTTTISAIFEYNKRHEEDYKTTIFSAIGGSFGGLLLVGALIFIFIFRKRSTIEKKKGQENEVSTYDLDGLQYNEFYVPAESISNSQFNSGFEHETIQNTRATDVHFSEIEIDDGQQNKQSPAFSKPKTSKKPKTALKPDIKSHNKSSFETQNIRYMNTNGENGSEYAVVDKSKNIQSTGQQAGQTSYAASSGDVYAVVNKS